MAQKSKGGGFVVFAVVLIVVLILALAFIKWPDIQKAISGNSNGSTGNSSTGGNSNGSNGTGSTSTGGNGSVATGSLSYNKTLSLNLYNSQEVGQLQRWLNQLQSSNQINVDNDFGPKTLAKLQSVTGWTSTTLGQMKSYYPWLS